MTKKDFILSILSSLIATFLFELGRKLYPRLWQLSIRVVALRIPLKKAILASYKLLKTFCSQFLQVATEILTSGGSRLNAGIFKSEIRFRTVMTALFAIVYVGTLIITIDSRNVEPSKENLEPFKDRAIADVDTLPYTGEVQTWAKSATSIVVKVPTREKGRFAYISIPKKFPQANPSSLNYLVNTNDGRCTAYIRSKANEKNSND